MGVVMRGVLALLLVLALSGSVTPTVALGDGVEPELAPLSPAATDAGLLGATSVTEPVTGEAGTEHASLARNRTAARDGALVGPDVDRIAFPGVTGGQYASTSSRATASDADTIHLDQRFERLPDQPGLVSVRLTYAIPDRVVSLGTAIPANATIQRRSGFDRRNDTHFVWDEATERPTLWYDLPVNETTGQNGRLSANGSYVAVDTHAWSLFERPATPTTWQRTGGSPIDFDRETSTVGPGATGEWLVYLGATDVYERTAHGQQFRLVVPAAASVRAPPDDILSALADSADALRVGDRDETVFALAAPTDGVTWGARGVQTGDSDFWVRDTEGLDDPDSAWIHEYVHTRQTFTTTDRTRWLAEATASYYASLLSLERETVEFDAFRERLLAGTDDANDDVVLANVSTWTRRADYDKGALVAGQLDRQLRTTTGREVSLQYLVRQINGQHAPVTQLDFLETLAAAGGTELLGVGQRYTETAPDVGMWNRTTHAGVFGQLPARVGYELPARETASAYRITGPYRNDSLAPAEPIVLVTGERLTLRPVVDNVGGTAGHYDLSLRVNGTVVNETGGTIGADESVSVPVSHVFPTPGHYRVAIDGHRLNVTVERPAIARVTDLSIDRTSARQGETVIATARVRNRASLPGEATVVFTRNFESVGVRQVRVPANGTTVVTRRIAFPRPGTVTIGAGSARPVELSVEPAPVQVSATPSSGTGEQVSASNVTTTGSTTSQRGPGFGPVGLAVAVFVFLAIGRYGHGDA